MREMPEERTTVPGWLAPLLVGIATLLLFREFVFSDRMLFGSDTLNLGYMARAFYAEHLRDGVFPSWNPLLLGGTPLVESLAAGDALYPTSLLLVLLEPYRALGWKLVIHVFLAGLFMFGWTRALGRSRGAALVAGLAYAVAPFLVTLVRPGHDGKLFVTALAPLLFWAMESTFVRRGLLPYVGVALVVALVILTTHFQLAYFLFGAAGLYYLFRVVVDARTGGGPRRPAPRFGLFLAASVVGAGVAAVQLLPAVDYVVEFSRRTATTTAASDEVNRAYASSWSMHPEEVAGLVVPEFPGNDAGGAAWTEGTYWGRNPTRDNHQYAGLVVLLLAAVGFLGGERRAVRGFLAGLGTLAVLYALGTHTPVWGLFYAVVPGISLFRAPDMVAFLFGFAAVTLAAFGVDRLLALARSGTRPGEAGGGEDGASPGGRGRVDEEGSGDRDGTGERILLVLASLTGLLFVGLLLAGSGALLSAWTSVVYPEIGGRSVAALETQRPFIVRGFFLAALLALLTTGIAWGALRGRLGRAVVVWGLLALVAADGMRISAPFIQTLDFEAWSRPDPIVERLLALQESEEPFRVASAAQRYQSVRPAMFGLELATGHHPNDLARYRELIGMEGSSEPRRLFEPNVYRLLNLRYLVVPGEVQGLEPLLQTRSGGRLHESLYELPTLPRARLVGEARVVGEGESLDAVLDPSLDPERTVVLTEEPPIQLAGGPVAGSVEWLDRGPDRQRLRVETDGAALLVVADNWFPAWRATVDGEEAPVLRAYHTLRAVPIGAGTHEVVLTYRSDVVRTSLLVSLVSLLLLVGSALLELRRRRGGSPDG